MPKQLVLRPHFEQQEEDGSAHTESSDGKELESQCRPLAVTSGMSLHQAGTQDGCYCFLPNSATERCRGVNSNQS